MSKSEKEQFMRPEVPSYGLVLYYHPHNFFSQKILIALYEKKIPFYAQVVDLTKGEQYSSWFLELNPRGEVPVLQNGAQIVPESRRILAYLEDHFNDANTPALFPLEKKRDILMQIVYFNRQISRLPISAISVGVFMHPELRKNAKHPLDSVTLESILKANKTARDVLQSYAKIDSSHAETLISRSEAQLKKISTMEERSEFLELVEKVNEILNKVEEQLIQQNFANDFDDQWLCCDVFSIADLSLAVLLHRLSSLGLESLFWKPHRPLTGKYYEKVCMRGSFMRSLPPPPNSMQYQLKMLVKQMSPTQVATVISVLSVAVVILPLLAINTK